MLVFRPSEAHPLHHPHDWQSLLAKSWRAKRQRHSHSHLTQWRIERYLHWAWSINRRRVGHTSGSCCTFRAVVILQTTVSTISGLVAIGTRASLLWYLLPLVLDTRQCRSGISYVLIGQSRKHKQLIRQFCQCSRLFQRQWNFRSRN